MGTSPATISETAWCGSLLYEERPMKRIKKFFKSDLGATAIEYGLIAALISVVIIAALQLTGNSLKTVFNNVANAVSGAAGNGSRFRRPKPPIPGSKRGGLPLR